MTTFLQAEDDKDAPKTRNYRASYTRIEADMRAKITHGGWRPGMLLPARRHLAQEYHVSLGTMEHAIKSLLADGTLKTKGRQGTFVSGLPIAADRVRFSSTTASRAIGIVCSTERRDGDVQWDQSWHHAIVYALERAIATHGLLSHFAAVRPSRESASDIDSIVDELCDEHVCGIVFVLCDKYIDEIQRTVATRSMECPPVICVNASEQLSTVSSVYYDNRDAGFRAARHLIDRGCRTFQFFAPYTSQFGIRRLEGIRQAIASAGLDASSLTDSVRLVPIGSEFTDEDPIKGLKWVEHDVAGAFWAEQVLASGTLAEGVIAVNDQIAQAFINAASSRNCKLGRDYAIVSFDDSLDARTHGITTMRPPLEQMGVEAGRLIVHAASGHQVGQNVCLHSELIARQSTIFERALS